MHLISFHVCFGLDMKALLASGLARARSSLYDLKYVVSSFAVTSLWAWCMCFFKSLLRLRR